MRKRTYDLGEYIEEFRCVHPMDVHLLVVVLFYSCAKLFQFL